MARNHDQNENASHVSSSFFKVMFGKDFAKVLYIPPKFAPLMTNLNGRKTYLEDSSGGKWKVSVSEVDGCLAFRQGWNDFFAGHGLEYGDILIFHYMETYFDVEIYNKSAIQRVTFPKSSQTKKRTGMDRECSNPLNACTELTNIKRKNSRKENMESDEQGKKSSARPRHIRNDQSQLKRDNVYREKSKTPRFQDQSRFKRDSVEINGDRESPDQLYHTRNYQSHSERNAVERDDFDETLPHFHNQEGQPQFERESVENNGDRETPSPYHGIKDRSQSERSTVERDDFEETPHFKRQNVEIDGGDTANPSSSCIEKAKVQLKKEFNEDSFFGLAWEGVKSTHNEARTAVLDLSEFELWGGCCLNQSGGIKASAVRNEFGDKDQGTSSCDVRSNETSNCASEAVAKVETAGEMFKNMRKSVAPIITPKYTGHILSGDHPRKPEPMDTLYGPVIAEKNKGHMMPADHQEHEYNKTVPAAVSGPSMPVIKEELVEMDALPLNTMKNKSTAQEKNPLAAKMEPKVDETFTDWPTEPLRAVATNPSFLELPWGLPGESLQWKKATKRVVLILQDPVKRLWPVVYNCNTTKRVLSQGWEDFCKANGVQVGDECIFHFRGNNVVYAVSVVKKHRVT